MRYLLISDINSGTARKHRKRHEGIQRDSGYIQQTTAKHEYIYIAQNHYPLDNVQNIAEDLISAASVLSDEDTFTNIEQEQETAFESGLQDSLTISESTPLIRPFSTMITGSFIHLLVNLSIPCLRTLSAPLFGP